VEIATGGGVLGLGRSRGMGGGGSWECRFSSARDSSL